MRKRKIRLDKIFGKQQLVLLKKYERIHGICIENNIPYHFINRCYKRYIKIKKEHGKDIFQNIVKTYLVAEKEGHKYNPNTRGAYACKMAKECGLSKYKTY